MYFLRVNVKFYDAVNMIHDVSKTVIHLHKLANSCFLTLEIIKLNKSDDER